MKVIVSKELREVFLSQHDPVTAFEGAPPLEGDVIELPDVLVLSVNNSIYELPLTLIMGLERVDDVDR